MNIVASKTYLSQPQWRRGESGAKRPMINPTAFREFGAPVYLLEDGQHLDGQATWREINRRLEETDYDPERDYFIVSGDVTVACLAFHAMMRRGGARMLRWDRATASYDVIQVPAEEEEASYGNR